MQEQNKTFINIIEEQSGWGVNEYDGYYYCQWFSPAGEEINVDVTVDNPFSDFIWYANHFDVDEHVEMWLPHRGTRGVPCTARTLVNDAEAIEKELNRISDILKKYI